MMGTLHVKLKTNSINSQKKKTDIKLVVAGKLQVTLTQKRYFLKKVASLSRKIRIDSLNLMPELPVLPSYRNQSIDLLCKSIDWFLYDGNFGI